MDRYVLEDEQTHAEARLYTQSLVKTLEAAPVTATVCLFPLYRP